jgi:resolvase-like protein
MAGLLAISAEFEREILQERTRAGLAQAQQNGKRLGRPLRAGLQVEQGRKLPGQGLANPRLPVRRLIGGERRHNGRQIMFHMLAEDRAAFLSFVQKRDSVVIIDFTGNSADVLPVDLARDRTSGSLRGRSAQKGVL